MENLASTPSPIGGRSFLDPAQIRILLAPVADVTEEEFIKWSDYVRSFETIRLQDIPTWADRKRPPATSPLYHVGEIHLSFVTSYDPDHSFLAPFNLHRQVLGVLGLTTFSSSVDKDALDRTPNSLRELHPGAVIHRVFGFDVGAKRPESIDLSSLKDVASNIHDTADSSVAPANATISRSASASAIPTEASREGNLSVQGADGLAVFPAVRKDGNDVRFYLKPLVAELVASILDGLQGIVTSLQGTSLETPRETLDGIIPTSASTAPTNGAPGSSTAIAASSLGTAASSAASRASALFSSFSSSSNSSSRPLSAIGGGSQPDMGFPSSSPSSLSSSPAPAESTKSKLLSGSSLKKTKRVQSIGGTGPTGMGRYAKVKADYHLLAGDLWSALEGYDACLTFLGKERALAGSQDAVWFASALEGWSVTRVLVSRMGGQVLEKAPCYDLPWANTKEKEVKEKLFAGQPWGEVAEAYSLALTIYSKCLAPPQVLLEPIRSVTNETPRDFTHPLIHAGACIQYARFLLAVWASGGWNGECFDQLVYGGVPPALTGERPSNVTYHKLSVISGVQRNAIATAASSALTHSVMALKASDQITLLSTLTSIFGCIGFSRREAYLLGQLQSAIISLLLKSRELHTKPPITLTLPMKHDVGQDEVIGNMVSQVTYDPIGKGSEAVLILAFQICKTHGIHVEVEPLANVPSFHILARAAGGLQNTYNSSLIASQNSDASDNQHPIQPIKSSDAILTPLELQNEAKFGWIEQQVGLLKETIRAAEVISDNIGMAYFATILLRDFHTVLSSEEQKSLYHGINRAVVSARWQGAQDLEVKYWGPPELLCSLELVSLPSYRLPLQRLSKDLVVEAQSNSDKKEESPAGLQNPFFWNPAKGNGAGTTANAKMVTAVAGEPIEIIATLQNPFGIDLEFDKVQLLTEGIEFQAHSIKTVVPASSFQTVRLSGIPKEAGKLRFKGTCLALNGCTEEEFTLPIFDETNQKERMKQAAEADDQRTRLKVIGLDARSAVIKQKQQAFQAAKTETKAKAQPEPRYLECQVAPQQPFVRIECPILHLGALDIFEGETKTIQLHLFNESDELSVNYLKLSFVDDLSEMTKQALAEGDLLPSDAHELEWDLLHRPVFSHDSKIQGQPQPPFQISIEPRSSLTLEIQVLGKLECTSGRITMEYSHVERTTENTNQTFFVRQLVVPVSITVHPLLDCSPIEIGPLLASEAAKLTAQCLSTCSPSKSTFTAAKPWETNNHEQDVNVNDDDGGESQLIETNLTAEQDSFCLITLDVRNVYRLPVQIRFELDTGGREPLRLYRTIKPLTTSRFVLPFRRLTLPEETVIQSIPSLGSRQFIVSRIQMSPYQQRMSKLRFWYRQALFQRFYADWRTSDYDFDQTTTTTDGSGWNTNSRFGKVTSLGHQMISDHHLQFLKKNDINIRLEILSDSSTTNQQVPVEQFIQLKSTIENLSAQNLFLNFRIIPISPSYRIDPTLLLEEDNENDHIVFSDGSSGFSSSCSSTIIHQINSVCFLSTGVYSLLALVQRVNQKDEEMNDDWVVVSQPLDIVVVSEE